MSRDELVRGYLDGQVSRRVFVRRLMASGVSAMAALAYVDILRTNPASAGTLGDFYVLVQDYSFTPDPAKLQKRGQRIRFNFSGSSAHTHSATDVSPLALFDTGLTAPGGVKFVDRFVAAGTYAYACKQAAHESFMTGTIKVPITVRPKQGPLGDAFKIIWASGTLAGYVFDVQRKNPGDANFTAWKTGVTTRSAMFTPGRRGTFRFRARLRRTSNGAASGWSTPKTLEVT
jgi:plastocyanin